MSTYTTTRLDPNKMRTPTRHPAADGDSPPGQSDSRSRLLLALLLPPIVLLTACGLDTRTAAEGLRSSAASESYDLIGLNVATRSMELDALPWLVGQTADCMTEWTFRFGDEIDIGAGCPESDPTADLVPRFEACYEKLQGETNQDAAAVCHMDKSQRLHVMELGVAAQNLKNNVNKPTPLTKARGARTEAGWYTLDVTNIEIDLFDILPIDFGTLYTGCYMSGEITASLDEFKFQESGTRWRADPKVDVPDRCVHWADPFTPEVLENNGIIPQGYEPVCEGWEAAELSVDDIGPALELTLTGGGDRVGTAEAALEITCLSTVLYDAVLPPPPSSPGVVLTTGEFGFGVDNITVVLDFVPILTRGLSFHSPIHPMNLRSIFDGPKFVAQEPHDVAPIESVFDLAVSLDGYRVYDSPLGGVGLYEDPLTAFFTDRWIDPLVNELLTEALQDSFGGSAPIAAIETLVGGVMSEMADGEGVCLISYDPANDVGPVVHHASRVICP